MRKYQDLLDEFLNEMKDRNRILAGKMVALKAFAGWLDDREKQQVRRQREASDNYIVPIQAAKIKQAE